MHQTYTYQETSISNGKSVRPFEYDEIANQIAFESAIKCMVHFFCVCWEIASTSQGIIFHCEFFIAIVAVILCMFPIIKLEYELLPSSFASAASCGRHHCSLFNAVTVLLYYPSQHICPSILRTLWLSHFDILSRAFAAMFNARSSHSTLLFFFFFILLAILLLVCVHNFFQSKQLHKYLTEPILSFNLVIKYRFVFTYSITQYALRSGMPLIGTLYVFFHSFGYESICEKAFIHFNTVWRGSIERLEPLEPLERAQLFITFLFSFSFPKEVMALRCLSLPHDTLPLKKTYNDANDIRSLLSYLLKMLHIFVELSEFHCKFLPRSF